MARITVEDCLEKIPSRFDLILMASKRARQLSTTSRDPLVEWDNDKPTLVALREIEEGLLDRETLEKTLEEDVLLDEFSAPSNKDKLQMQIIVIAKIFTPSFDFYSILLILTLLGGIGFVIPIGGGDMPVVISLLNSFSGIAAAFAGLLLLNNVLIVAGSLVGASGLILTIIMAKAMNRSIGNILFVGYASSSSGPKSEETGEVKPINVSDAYLILENASSVLVIPGYGMAVAQAQHVVRELGELLEANGTEVKYGIHPVAGRMPGHMNVLLAEANVPYDVLVEPDDVNPSMDSVDVAVVIGANDVVNPSATEEPGSPIYGMPIIEAHNARTVFVLKRSMSSGFAGVQNPLFFKENTRMLFGDAKESIGGLVAEFKE